VPLGDEVKRVAGVAFVEDHLVPREAPPPGERKQRLPLVRRQHLEDLPLHGAPLTSSPRHTVRAPRSTGACFDLGQPAVRGILVSQRVR
jgi:hypothetical protein